MNGTVYSRLARDRKEIQKDYLNFLRGPFKGAEYVELAYNDRNPSNQKIWRTFGNQYF